MPLRLRLLLTLVPLFVVGLAAADIGTYAALQSSEFSRVDQQIIDAHQSGPARPHRRVVGNRGSVRWWPGLA